MSDAWSPSRPRDASRRPWIGSKQSPATGGAAALIVEPLVLGAGGMLMYPAWVLTELKKIAEASGTLLIADEVMTGSGRTGTMFACEQASMSPDILCTSEGLTGGVIPLAATLATDPIFQAHFSEDRRKTFFACAAALANVEIWRDEPVAKRIATLGARQPPDLNAFATTLTSPTAG